MKGLCSRALCRHKGEVDCEEFEVEINTEELEGLVYVNICKECMIEALAEMDIFVEKEDD